MGKKFTWTVELTVDEYWVEDGFNMRSFNGSKGNDAAKERMAKLLPYANGSEFSVRVLTSPPDADIAKVQGYASAAAMLRA